MSEGAPKSGTQVGRYRLQDQLGRGTMGEVWRAYDSSLKRAVAIKLLDPLQDNPNELERFLREARALGRLNHPNVVTVHDVGEWRARPFIVMELLEGRTLADELAEQGQLPVEDVRAAGIAIANGLCATHEAGVVHRDLSPDNLMRAGDGTLKLVDFGIADVGRQARLTRPGILLGSVNYVAPERVKGERADARCDLYSLGCVLYELLCGRPPFDGDLVAIAFAHVFNDVVPPSSVRPDVPDDLEAVVLALLAKEPAARPATAARVVSALRDGVALPAGSSSLGGAEEPAAGSGGGRRGRLARRAASLLTAVGVVALVLGMSSWLAPDVQRPAKAAPPSAVAEDVQPGPLATSTRRPTMRARSHVQPLPTTNPRPTTTTRGPLPLPTATVTSVVTVSPTSEPTAEQKSKKEKKPKKPKKDKG